MIEIAIDTPADEADGVPADHLRIVCGECAELQEIADTVVTSPAGIIAQVELLAAAPATLADAAVKLRRLADPDIGIEAGATAEDPGSIRQVLEVVESLLGKTDAEQFLAAEREVAEVNSLDDRAVPEGWTDEELKPINCRYDAATEFIGGTEPQSMVAAVVKLRRLLDTDSSPLGGYDPELASLRQVVAFLERMTGGTADQVRAEPEVIGFGEPEPRP